jgi:NAD(P)-dependent dehydrogenase (short-subunit alcohol dehydrogenase family)
MSDFKGRTAVVTGGNSGIGLATARKLVARGANVVIFGRDARTLATALKELGPNARAVQGDVSKLTDLDRLYDEARKAFGGVDIVFANAGIAEFRPVAEVDDGFYDKIMDANVKGAYFTAQKALPHFKGPGSIVFNTSGVNVKGWPNTSVYAATKAALRSLTRTFAAELAPRTIRVNAVSPGPIETPIFGRLGMPADAVKEFTGGIVAQVPLKRFGTADEVADAVLFLVSEQASSVPVMKLACSLTRKRTASATSSAVPNRLRGTCATIPPVNSFTASAGMPRRPKIGVSIGPGETALTRIVRGASSAAKVRVRLRSAALVAA